MGRVSTIGIVLTTLLASLIINGSGLTGSATAAQVNARKAPFLIGMTLNLSGPLAPYSAGDNLFFAAWMDYVNSNGGVQGHKIDVITLDDKGDPGQSLLNLEALWSQDHVLAVYSLTTYTPWAYIKANNIPYYSESGGAGSRGFGSFYSTFFPTGSLSPTWFSQDAYWAVKIEHKAIKTVEVDNSPTLANWNDFILNYWHKLGADNVYIFEDQGPTANCTPLVLQMKAQGVQYFDIESNEFVPCISAENTLGWRPPLGEGGTATSSIGTAELLGKTLVGVVAGSPDALYTGKPIYKNPPPLSRTLVGTIRTYAPQYANYSYLNGTSQIQSWSGARLITTALDGTLTKYHKVTPKLLVKYTQSMKNFNGEIIPSIASFAPNCKTGGDGTIWGYWHYNPHPTATRPTMYMVPTSGPAFVSTRTFLGYGKCYLTQLTNQQFPNG